MSSKIIAGLSLLGLLFIAGEFLCVNGDYVPWVHFGLVDGKRYYAASSEIISDPSDAKRVCEAKGMRLPSVDTPKQKQNMIERVRPFIKHVVQKDYPGVDTDMWAYSSRDCEGEALEDCPYLTITETDVEHKSMPWSLYIATVVCEESAV